MLIITGALRPDSEAPRRSWQTVRGTTNYISSNADNDNEPIAEAQVAGPPPRIIATHWLRPFLGGVSA